MYICNRRHIPTHPHIRTYTYTHAGSAMFAALDSSSTHPIQHYTSNAHLFLYYVLNIEYNEYNDDNNISAMNDTYI